MIKDKEHIYTILKEYFAKLGEHQPENNLDAKILNEQIAEIISDNSSDKKVLKETTQKIEAAEKRLEKEGVLKLKNNLLCYKAPIKTKASKFADDELIVKLFDPEQTKNYVAQLFLGISTGPIDYTHTLSSKDNHNQEC